MEEKETVAQMMRRWERERIGVPCKVCRELYGFEGDCTEDRPELLCRNGWTKLAYMIKDEIEEARCTTVAACMDAMARLNDWPMPKDGERLREWINRCFLPRPRFEDGEPLQLGDVVGGFNGVVKSISICDNDISAVAFRNDDGPTEFGQWRYNERLARPKPKVLDAYGVPIEVGDTVWFARRHHDRGAAGPYVVGAVDERGVHLACDGSLVWNDADLFTHTEPDTQKKIDEDSIKDVYDYWGCVDRVCKDCPSKIDGITPREHYRTDYCHNAKVLDLLRRQRELYKRLMGGE